VDATPHEPQNRALFQPLGAPPRPANPERNPMPTINSSREFHPGRWLALVAAACFAAYLFGVNSATPADPAHTSSPAASCPS
jgi:hypothetical protein